MTIDYDAAGHRATTAPGLRIERLEEALEIIKGLWAEDPVDFAGAHYRITALDGQPKPLQRPHPPHHRRWRGQTGARARGPRGRHRRAQPEPRAGVIDARRRRERRRRRRRTGEDRLDPRRRPASGSTTSSCTCGSTSPLVTDDRDAALRGVGRRVRAHARPRHAETPHALVRTVESDRSTTCSSAATDWGISNIGISAEARSR